MKFSELKPNEKNPRRVSEKKLEMLKKSLERFGSLDGIVFNRSLDRIVGGHQRQKLDPEAEVVITTRYDEPDHQGTVALGVVKIGTSTVPYREVEWDEPTDLAANIAANKGAGDWNLDSLREMMLELDHLNFDLELTMFDEEERENLIVPIERVPPAGDPDHVPAAPKEPNSKRGDLYRLGDHYLLCGDSTQIDDVERLMAGEKADMVWTDPPYNVDYKGSNGLTIENDSMGGEDFRTFLRTAFSNMSIVTRAGGPIYIAHADLEGVNFRMAMTEGGFLFKQCLVWVKNALVMGRSDYHWRHEPILYGWKEGAAHSWEGDRKQSTVLEFKKTNSNDVHPTMKPVELVEYCIRNSSKVGDIVVDLFGGSGTTMIACEKSTRKARLMELSPSYCDVIIRRWEEYTGNKAELVTQ